MDVLTIGLPVYDDYDGAYFTVQALRMYHGNAFKIIVIDTQPSGQHALRDLCTSAQAAYYHEPHGIGPAYGKQKVFEHSTTPFTMCIDCHVLLPSDSIKKLTKFLLDNWNSNDLYQGPLVYDDMINVSTHFDPVWSGDMFGTWGTNPQHASGDPFEIPMQGCGLLLMRTKSWPGFNYNFRGFGGEEGYIQEKTRQKGGKNICLPFLKWLHRFNRPKGIPFRLVLEDRIFNYIVGRIELGLPYDDVLDHFKTKITQEKMAELLAEAQQVQAPGMPRSFSPGLLPVRANA
jgi:hypothetical protein